MRFLVVLVGIFVATTSPAFAQDASTPPESAPVTKQPETDLGGPPAKKLKINVAVGLKGGLSGSLVSGVPENEPIDDTGLIDPNLYPMFGLGGGVGMSFEGRVNDFIGLETGFFISFDNATGFEDINDTSGATIVRRNQTQTTTAWHIPLLLKLIIPGELVQPVFGLGVEFVLQGDSTLEFDPPNLYKNVDYAIEPQNYTLMMLTLGLEFKVGAVRIPLELRTGYNVGFENTASARADFEGRTITYFGAYQGHFGLFTGITYDYDFFL